MRLFAKRALKTATVATLVAAVMVGSCAHAQWVAVTGDITLNKEEIGGVTHDLSGLTQRAAIVLNECSVNGATLGIAGKLTDTTKDDKGVAYLASSLKVTASIQFLDQIPSNSEFRFTDTDAQIKGSDSVFVLSDNTFTWNTTLSFVRSMATWTEGAGPLVSFRSRLNLEGRSAVFVKGGTLRGASSALHTQLTVPGTILEGSVVAVDEVTCVDCTGALVNLVAAIDVSGSSLFRVEQSDSGRQPLVNQQGPLTVRDRSLYTLVDSVSSGAALVYGSSFTVSGGSAVSFKKLVGSPLYSGAGSIPTTTSSDSQVSGSTDSQSNSIEMTTRDDFLSAGIVVGNVVSADDCSNALCVPGLSTGASDTSGACTCTCIADTYSPYCTYMRDGDRSDDDNNCPLANCRVCNVAAPGKCSTCIDGYRLNDDASGCVPVRDSARSPFGVSVALLAFVFTALAAVVL